MLKSTQAIRCCRHQNSPRVVGLVLTGISLALAAGCHNLASRGHNAQGVRLFAQGRYQEALREFHEATYIDPRNPDGYYNVAATHHRLGSAESRQADLDRAENYYNLSLTQDETCGDCYRGLAVLYAQRGRGEEAFRLIEGWSDRQPIEPNAKIELARLCEEFGDKAAAKERLSEALGLDPDNARAWTALGKLREDVGEREQALADYQRSLRHDPRQPQVAARVSALQSTITPPLSITVPDGGTRMAEKGSTSLR